MRRLPDVLSMLLISLALLSVLLPYTSSLLPLEFLEFPYLEKFKEFSQQADWLPITNQYQTDISQPPLLCWFSKVIYNQSQHLLWSARLPSVLLAVFLMLSLYKMGTRYFDDRIGFWWVLMLMASPLVFLVFKSASSFTAGMVFSFMACYRLQRGTYETKGAQLNFLVAAIYTGLGSLSFGLPVLIFCFGNYIFHLLNERFNVRERLTDVLMYVVISVIIFAIWPLTVFLSGNTVDWFDWFSALAESYRYGLKFSLLFLLFFLGYFPFNVFSLASGRVRNDNRMDQRHFLKWMRQMIGFAGLFMFLDYRMAFLAAVPIAFLAAYAMAFHTKDGYYWPVGLNSLLMLIGMLVAAVAVGLAWLPSFKNEVAYYLNLPQLLAHLQHMEPSLSGKLLGVAITLLMLISAVLLMRKRLGEALHMLLVGLMVLLPLFFGWVIVPIKSQTDGPLVRFFRDYEGQIGTVAAYDVNPAQVAFYARVQTTVVSPFDLTPLDSVGKYMVAAVPQEKNIDRYFKSFTKIRKEGGWLFYKYTPALSKH